TSAARGSPCSWMTSTPACCASAAISSTSSAPNTPTATGPPAAAAYSPRACAGVTLRGPPAKIAPTYAAPIRAASRASSARVMPQNLTLTTRAPRDSHERGRGRSAVARRRERRPDEHRVSTERRRAFDIRANLYAALVHRRAMRRHELEQAFAYGVVDDERLEVPVVDADHRPLDVQRVLEFS